MQQNKNPRRFALRNIGYIRSVQVDSIIPDDPDAATQNVSVSVTTEDGAIFRVGTFMIANEGILGYSFGGATLVAQKTWTEKSADKDVVPICPLCFEEGHGAMACENVSTEEH